MKYMGSKRAMLKNGLGDLLLQQASYAYRVVDLFTGAGSVACFVAENTDKPVFAIDLQRYSTVLAEAVISRTSTLSAKDLYVKWIIKSVRKRNRSIFWKKSKDICLLEGEISDWVTKARSLCESPSRTGALWNAYGGHYFSPSQAITFDYLINNLPNDPEERIVCLAACITAASECVASPGHTAQPFQPTEGAGKYIVEAWKRDPIFHCKRALENICPRYAKVVGQVSTSDALEAITQLNANDLVFIDPPYSSVQYSRFYHVLETIALEKKLQPVSGIGRNPPFVERPQSKFSNISQAKDALKTLLYGLAERKCRVIFTFPSGKSSNGLSGEFIKSTAIEWFIVEDKHRIEGVFSTLGGNNGNRNSRHKSDELILLLQPKIK